MYVIFKFRRIVQIIDCCKYLGQQSSECETKGLVSILSNLNANDPKLSLRVKQTLQSAQQEGCIAILTLNFDQASLSYNHVIMF